MTRVAIRDAIVLTGDEGGTAYARGHLVTEGARIAALGPGDPPTGPYDETVAADGQVLIPGLVDTHGHAWLYLLRGLNDDAELWTWGQRNARLLPGLGDRELRAGSELACFELAHAGITTAVESCRFEPAIFAEAASTVGLRSLTGGLARGPSPDAAVRGNWPELARQTERALERFGGDDRCRFFLGAHSPYNCSPEILADIRREADRLRLPLGIHLAETQREDGIVRERYRVSPTRYLAEAGWLGERTLLAHAVWLDAEDIALIAESGAAVAHCPTSNAKLASGVAPVPALRAAGVAVGLGTDSVLSNNRLDLLAEMRAASLVQRAVARDAELLPAREVFGMATLEGARAIGWSDEIGSLEVGKQADLVMLDADHPLGHTPARALSDVVWAMGPEDVRHVMVAGRWVLRDRSLAAIDERARRDEIRAALAS